MALLPVFDRTIDQIYRSYETKPQTNRRHLGVSQIGGDCRRELWYIFRWVQPRTFSGRMLRLFNRGFLEEETFVRELRSIGVKVWERDKQTGKQFSISFLGGHLSGSVDGVVQGIQEAAATRHLLEIKTHNKKSFAALLKNGVEKSKPQHYAQMIVYMHGLKLKRALYLAVCKDDDSLYQERIHSNSNEAQKYVHKAELIIKSPTPSSKISDDANWYQCKFCDFLNICHKTKLVIPLVNCRTCLHSTPDTDTGYWACARHDNTEIDNCNAPCQQHLFIPDIMPWDMLDASEKQHSVAYATPDGVLVNGEGSDHIPSNQLIDVESLISEKSNNKFGILPEEM